MLDKPNRLMPDPRFLDELFEAGAHLFPLVAHDDESIDLRARGKKAWRKGWNSPDAKPLTREEAVTHMRAGRNLGERLKDDLVIDIDPRNFANGMDYSDPDKACTAAIAAFEDWCAELGIDGSGWPIFITGSGGLHVRLKKPGDLDIVTKLEGRPGFEFKTAGTYIVTAGSVHAMTGRLYEPWFLNLVRLKDAPLAPAALLDLLKRPAIDTSAGGGGELEPEELGELLAVLDPADFRDHDKWFSLMCAAHHATNGDGEDVFLAWSGHDPMYSDDIEINRDRWRSLRSDKPGIATVATLYQAVSKAGCADLIPQPRNSAADAFDDVDPEWLARDAASEAEPKSDAEAPQVMRFTPYAFKDPSAIPPRDWLMKPNYIRQFATGTLGHGGVGKSILLMVEAVALASGQPLLDTQPYSQSRWLYWNGEDPVQELDRRFAAIRKHHDLSQEDLEGYLFVDSGRVLPIDIVTIDPRTRIAVPRDRDALIEALQHHELDGVTIDPFVASHSVPENANEMIEEVAEAWNDVAERANVAIHISHHAVKARGRDVEAMDYRGGGAALAKLRNLRVLNGMTEKEAKKAGIDPAKRRYYFRADDGAKANLLPPAERTEWSRPAISVPERR